MNLKRGVNRIALVLSALWFVYFSAYGILGILLAVWGFVRQPIFLYIFLGPIAVWIAVWIIYWSTCWIVKGFRDDEPKDEQKS